jgi:hypothetical protein
LTGSTRIRPQRRDQRGWALICCPVAILSPSCGASSGWMPPGWPTRVSSPASSGRDGPIRQGEWAQGCPKSQSFHRRGKADGWPVSSFSFSQSPRGHASYAVIHWIDPQTKGRFESSRLKEASRSSSGRSDLYPWLFAGCCLVSGYLSEVYYVPVLSSVVVQSMNHRLRLYDVACSSQTRGVGCALTATV